MLVTPAVTFCRKWRTFRGRTMIIQALLLLSVASPSCLGFSAPSVPRSQLDSATPSASSLAAMGGRRNFLALASTTVIPLLALADADPRATVTIHLDSSRQRAGLELYETTIGTPPRNVVAVKSVLSGGVASKISSVQPGMILLDYTDAKTVTERIKNGPYPLDLRLYNLAAGGDAFGDMGKPLVTAQDALQMAKNTKGVAEKESAASASGGDPGFVIRVTKKAPSSCGIQSRRGDVLEIIYEARYGSRDGIIYDSSAQRGTGQPYQFVLGSGDMIPGVDQGLYDMCPGEERDLEIPPILAYGNRGSKLFDIPGGQRLFWSVQLVRVNSVAEGDERTRDELEGRVL